MSTGAPYYGCDEVKRIFAPGVVREDCLASVISGDTITGLMTVVGPKL